MSACVEQSRLHVVLKLYQFLSMRLMHSLTLWAYALCSLFVSGAAPDPANLLANGGFEAGVVEWRSLWCRDANAGTLTLDHQDVHGGTNAVRIEHRGEHDWSFEPSRRIDVLPGDIYEMEAWLKLQGTGNATVCVSTWDAQGRNMGWSYGGRSVRASEHWAVCQSRFVVPPGVVQIQPRLIGYGPSTVWMDDYRVAKAGNVSAMHKGNLPGELYLTNQTLTVGICVSNATLTVLDHRTGRCWRQQPTDSDVVVVGAKHERQGIQLDLMHVPSAMAITIGVELDAERPEFTFTVTGNGELHEALRYPYPFGSESGDRLVVPMNEGISYPVDDPSIETFRLIAYGGHGICMAFWGVTDDRKGYSAIIETPDDAAIHLVRQEGRLAIAPEWDPQKGQFGYTRKLRYVFFDQGGHVAIAKRYREHARATGLFKTLAQKRSENPNVDLLVGAVNVWNWDAEPVALVREMQTAGIERILWSRGGSGDVLKALNDMKVLTSRYDIYQDMMDPAKFSMVQWKHPDWTTAAWPKDIILKSDGDWLRGWGIEGKNGEWFHCGVLCDRQAVDYARQRVPAELSSKPYLCRFIDTTTAAPWNECYHTNHPMTRTESRVWKMKLLDYMSREMKLVTGSETGHDAAVPFLHYFEGMLSLGPYRVPDAGRDMQRIWNDVPEPVAKFQLGHACRLPLWELVYHDCVVAQWYWGDYNNKLPSLWEKRDLFNLLYGTPPMFMFDRKLWQSQKDRFVQSYRNTCPYVRAVGYQEMTDHQILTKDRNVQRTVFANGVTITVNFGAAPYQLPSGQAVPPMGFTVSGMTEKAL